MVRVLVEGRAPLAFPSSPCCNCGGGDDLARVTCGVFALPFCPGCRKSARRVPTNWFVRVAVWAMIFLPLLFFGGPIVHGLGARAGALTLAIVAAIPVIAAWAIARPRGAQTSYYQPVRYHWVSGLVFTNPTYAARVIDGNPGRVQIQGALASATVRGGGVGEHVRARLKAARRPAAFVALFALVLVALGFLFYVLAPTPYPPPTPRLPPIPHDDGLGADFAQHDVQPR